MHMMDVDHIGTDLQEQRAEEGARPPIPREGAGGS